MGTSNETGKIIEKTVNKACEKYRKALQVFKPQSCNKNGEENGFPERNLSCYFAQTFLRNNKEGYVFFEVPFKFGKGTKYKHIDAYVVSDKIGILIETKRLHTIEKFRKVAEDASRLSCKELEKTIKKNNENKKYLKVPHFALILAEAWGEDFKVWWENDSKDIETKWEEKWGERSLKKFKDWNEEYDNDKVFKFLRKFDDNFGASKEPYHTYDGRESNKGVYCLYAYSRIW